MQLEDDISVLAAKKINGCALVHLGCGRSCEVRLEFLGCKLSSSLSLGSLSVSFLLSLHLLKSITDEYRQCWWPARKTRRRTERTLHGPFRQARSRYI